MTEAKLKAYKLVESYGLKEAIERCKKILAVVHENLELEQNESSSNLSQFWGDVMDELNEMI